MKMRNPFLTACAFALFFGLASCSTTSTSTDNLDDTDSSMTMPNGTESDTAMEGTGGDTSMNNDGMKNDGGAVIDTTDPNNKPNEDGRLPVRGHKK